MPNSNPIIFPNEISRIVSATNDNTLREQSVLYHSCYSVPLELMRDPSFKEFVEEMYRAMKFYDGVGIAANQCGANCQVFWMEFNPNTVQRYRSITPVPKMLFINPVILEASEERMSLMHGCLSAIKEKRGKIATYSWLEVEAYRYEAQGEPEKFHVRLTDFAAIIFQHEFRHLLGGTYLDLAQEYHSTEELLGLYCEIPLPKPCFDPAVPSFLPRDCIGKPIVGGQKLYFK